MGEDNMPSGYSMVSKRCMKCGPMHSKFMTCRNAKELEEDNHYALIRRIGIAIPGCQKEAEKIIATRAARQV